MSVTTPSTGQKISDFSVGTVDADSYLIQARNGSTSKVAASQIGQFSNLNLLFNGTGGLDTTNKTIVGAINEVNAKDIGDIKDVNLSSPADGDILAYDSTSSKWVNKVFNSSAYPLFYTRTFTYTKTLQANSADVVTRSDLGMTNDVPDGYERLGITHANSNVSAGMIGSFSARASTNILRVYNSSSAAINATFTIDVIYVRSGFLATYTPPSS